MAGPKRPEVDDAPKRSLGLVGVLPLLLLAPDRGFAKEIIREFRSPRYLGMGDAGTASAVGSDAIFYNPAGIAAVEGIFNEAVLVSPAVTLGSETRALYDDILKDDGNDALGLAQKNTNRPHHAGVQVFSGIVFRRAAFGVLTSSQIDAFVGNDIATGLPLAEASTVTRLGGYLTFARGFFNDKLLIGGNIKYAQKAEAALAVNALEAQSINGSALRELLKRGSGGGLDLGFLFLGGGRINPRFGLTVHNVGGLRYIPSDANFSAPDPDPQTVDVAVALHPGTKKSDAKLAFEVRDVANRQKESIYKRIHLGGEISFRNVVGIQGGLFQGYPTFGGFLNVKIVRLEGGVYSTELGDLPNDRQGKRLFGRLSVGWMQ